MGKMKELLQEFVEIIYSDDEDKQDELFSCIMQGHPETTVYFSHCLTEEDYQKAIGVVREHFDGGTFTNINFADMRALVKHKQIALQDGQKYYNNKRG